MSMEITTTLLDTLNDGWSDFDYIVLLSSMSVHDPVKDNV